MENERFVASRRGLRNWPGAATERATEKTKRLQRLICIDGMQMTARANEASIESGRGQPIR